MTVSILTRRPSWARFCTTPWDQGSFEPTGRGRTHAPSVGRRRPRFGWRGETFRPRRAARHRRRTAGETSPTAPRAGGSPPDGASHRRREFLPVPTLHRRHGPRHQDLRNRRGSAGLIRRHATAALVRADAAIRRRGAALTSIPGIGPSTVTTLLTVMQKLGSASAGGPRHRRASRTTDDPGWSDRVANDPWMAAAAAMPWNCGVGASSDHSRATGKAVCGGVHHGAAQTARSREVPASGEPHLASDRDVGGRGADGPRRGKAPP
jgi:hypothetical protein